MKNYEFILSLPDELLKREAIREICKHDLYFLAKYILGYKDLETVTDIHIKLCELLDKDLPRLLVLMFRGSYKTSIGLAKVVQWLIRSNGQAQIGIGSDLPERAAERVRELRNILQYNHLLKDLFPEIFYEDPVTQSDLWRADEFNVKRDVGKGGFKKPSVSAFGLFPLPTGSHYTHVLLDDVENETNTNTEELVTQLNSRVAALIPTFRPDTVVVMLGTIYGEGGPNMLYQTRWPTYRRPILDKNGEPTFPSKFPLSYIEKLRKEIGDEYIWEGQYMLRPGKRFDENVYPFFDKTLKRCTIILDDSREFVSPPRVPVQG